MSIKVTFWRLPQLVTDQNYLSKNSFNFWINVSSELQWDKTKIVIFFNTLYNFTNRHFIKRYLQTLNSISAENNSTIVFPVPIDILSQLMNTEPTEEKGMKSKCKEIFKKTSQIKSTSCKQMTIIDMPEGNGLTNQRDMTASRKYTSESFGESFSINSKVLNL